MRPLQVFRPALPSLRGAQPAPLPTLEVSSDKRRIVYPVLSQRAVVPPVTLLLLGLQWVALRRVVVLAKICGEYY